MTNRNYQRIGAEWVATPAVSLYPHSDKGKQVKYAGRVIVRALEFCPTAAESNCLFDMSGRYKCDRHQAFTAHRQVWIIIL